MAQQVMNSNIIHEERDWIPGLTLLSKDPDLPGRGSFDVGIRLSSHPSLPWWSLWVKF